MKKSFAAVTLLLAAAGLAACGGNGGESATNVIRLGNSGPLTGAYGIYGTGVKNAVTMAVEEINAKGGIQFTYTAKDDEGDGEKAAQNFNSLFEGGMQVSLGCVTSGACVSFKGADESNEMFMLTPSATADAVYKAGVYQMCFSDSGQGTAAAQYIYENETYRSKRIGVLYNASQDYSKGIYTNFAKAMDEYGLEYTVATFADDKAASFAGQVSTLKDCDLIFLPIYYTPATTFINNAKNTIAADAVYFGADGLDGIDGVEGFDVNSFTQKISMLSHFNSGSSDAATKSFVDAYNAKYDPSSLNQFAASAYDCTYAIYDMLTEYNASATTKVNSQTSAKDIKAILEEKIKTFTFSGVTGKNIKWNENRTVNKTPVEYEINPNRQK